MPVFYHPENNVYAMVSYKVLYSKFHGSTSWRELGLYPTPRLLLKAMVQDRPSETFSVVRCPYQRLISCFMDKFRKQPARINEPGFTWQACHKLMFPLCGLDVASSDETIAQRFLDFSFDEFVDLLPLIYKKDVHFQPQSWTSKVQVGGSRIFDWPFCRLIRVEASEFLNLIPGIDWSVRRNTTGHIDRDFNLLEKHKIVVRKLYHSDFRLGNYAD